MESFDVIIIGKTITGLLLACGLSSNLKIAILDVCVDKQLVVKAADTAELINMSMISVTASRLLQYIQIWDNYADYANPYYSIDISEQDSFNHFTITDSLGYPCLGYIINNSILYKRLLFRSYELKNIYFISSTPLCRLIRQEDAMNIIIDDQRSLSGKLIVVAGADQDSLLYQSLDISLVFWDTSYYILVGTLISEHSHPGVVHYCFQRESILILLPLKESNCFFVFWLLHSSYINVLSNINRKSWDDFFMRSFNKLGKVYFQEDICLLPCIFRYIKSFLTDRVLLLGSSVSYDVSFLKYQNLNRDLMDIAILLEKINKYDFFNLDSEKFFDFRDYEKYRKSAAIKIFSKEQFMCSCFFRSDVITKFFRTVVFQILNCSSSVVTKFDFINNLMELNSVPGWLLRDYFD